MNIFANITAIIRDNGEVCYLYKLYKYDDEYRWVYTHFEPTATINLVKDVNGEQWRKFNNYTTCWYITFPFSEDDISED